MRNRTTRNGGFLRDIRLRSVIIIMIVIASVISLFLLMSMHQTTVSYETLQTATQEYVDSQNAADNMQSSIDALSNQARSFVVTGSPEHAILYCNEIQVQRTRDRAMEEVKKHLSDERALNHLETAMTLSDRMIETECYAMRLAIEARGDSLDRFPEVLRAIELYDADRALDADAQLALAQSRVFDNTYETMKGQTQARISLCVGALGDEMLENQSRSSRQLFRLLRRQRILVYALMLTLFGVAVIIFAMVIAPLTKQISNISNDRMLDERGTAELQFLARTYNRMYEQTQKTYERLSYEAMHDALTGLYNRNTYDVYRDQCQDQDIALLLVDVDHFKEINDTYGHDVGDQVLIHVAQVLQNSFRSEDLVCRIGGDEFSIIMVNSNSSMEAFVRERISRVMQRLAQEESELPAVTLSVGVAFADQKREGENLFRNADRALYQIKTGGRNGCGFFRSGEVSE